MSGRLTDRCVPLDLPDVAVKAYLLRYEDTPFVDVLVRHRNVGTMDEPMGHAGVCEVVGALVSEGLVGVPELGDLDREEFAMVCDRLGVSVGVDMMRNDCRTSANLVRSWPAGWFLVGRVPGGIRRGPAFLVDRVRHRVLEALRAIPDAAAVAADRLWWRTMFAGHPAGRTEDDAIRALEALSTGDLVDAVSERLDRIVAAPSVMAVAGDVDVDGVWLRIQSSFRFPPSGTEEPEIASLPKTFPSGTVTVTGDWLDTCLVFGWPIDALPWDEDWAAVSLTVAAFGGDPCASSLGYEIRERRGLSYGAYAHVRTVRLRPFVIGRCVCSPESVDEVAELIDHVVGDFRRGEVDERVVEAARRRLTTMWIDGLTDPSWAASAVVDVVRHDRQPETIDRFVERLATVTVDDVRRTAERLFAREPLYAVARRPPERRSD